jgi:small conductance mechanosensitive channel
MPMRQDRLVDEADAWLGLLQAKVAELSLVELDVRTATGAARQPLLAQANELRIERDRLATRLAVVLDSLEAKGGDVTEYRAYASAVSGIEFDWWDPAAAWQAFVGWLVSPEGGIKWGLAILKFIVIVIIARIISNIVGRIVRQGVKRMKNASALLKDFFVMIARQTVFLIGVVMAIGALGINVGPVLAAIGGIAFIIGFALQGTLSNFASGVMILLYRPYDVGSVVNVAGVSGIVESMTLVSTSIKTFDNQLIIVPNNSIWGDVITNVTGKDTRRVDLTFGVSYSEDMAKAESILSGVLSAHPKVLADPAPTIKVHELADSSVNFICRPWVKTADYWEVYWDVMRTVKERFDAEGVTIPFPQRDVHVFNK